MGYPIDNPLDGRGARPDDNDGGVYAEGHRVCLRPKRGPNGGISLGGTIAEAQDEKTAAEIAHRCALHDPLLEALRALTAWCDDRALHSDELHAAKAALARAEDR